MSMPFNSLPLNLTTYASHNLPALLERSERLFPAEVPFQSNPYSSQSWSTQPGPRYQMAPTYNAQASRPNSSSASVIGAVGLAFVLLSVFRKRVNRTFVCSEANLAQPVQQKLSDIRAILAHRPGNLQHVYINPNRARSSNTELCFTFADVEHFPEPQRSNDDYSMGTIQFFLPTDSIPAAAFGNVRRLKKWLNMPQICNQVSFRVQR